MSSEYNEMCDEFSNLIKDEDAITGNMLLEILKKYSSTVSVFDMMEFTSNVIRENRYVQESYREESQKSYIESFLLRTKEITRDKNNYPNEIDKKSFAEAVEVLKTHIDDSESKSTLIFDMASVYATFILNQPIHPVGTPFPGSLKVEEQNGEFLCPVKDANEETPNAVCKICLAKQLDF